MISLHLGCGKRYLPEFTYHIDLADYDHIDLQHDIASLPMFKDDSVDLIYACHCLEYYDRKEVLDVLKEWNRVLKVGGILRLAVPDFEAWVKVYEQNHDMEALLGALYGRWQIGNTDKIIYHKTCYDFESLKWVLEFCGFWDVQRYDAKEVMKDRDDFSLAFWPHIKDCKTREEYINGMSTSLNVECAKL